MAPSDYARISGVVIFSAELLRNTPSGNPRYKLHTSEGTFETEPDASLGWGIANYSNSAAGPWVVGNPAGPEVALRVTRNNRVTYLEYDGQVLN